MSYVEARRVYRAANIGGTLPRGARPGVVVVDLQRGFTEATGPVGTDLGDTVEATRTLLRAARAAGVPTVFTVIAYGTDAEAGVWLHKMPALAQLREGSGWVDVDPRLERRDDEPLLHKHGASALHGTNVAAMLTAAGVDTVIVAGATTSGCIRATVVDLMQAGFPTLVVRDCCGDRASGPHEANLFDIDAKYADVIPLDEAVDYLASVADRSATGTND